MGEKSTDKGCEESYPSENLDEIGLESEKLGHSLGEIDLSDTVVVGAAAGLELKRRES